MKIPRRLSLIPGDPPAPHRGETWISAVEAAALLNIQPKTIIKRIQKGSLVGEVSSVQPITVDGNTPTSSLSEKELCKRLGLDSGTITPVLKKLEATGLVTRARRKDDERVVEITLTEEGSALRGKIGNGPEIGLTDEQVEVLEKILTELE